MDDPALSIKRKMPAEFETGEADADGTEWVVLVCEYIHRHIYFKAIGLTVSLINDRYDNDDFNLQVGQLLLKSATLTNY